MHYHTWRTRPQNITGIPKTWGGTPQPGYSSNFVRRVIRIHSSLEFRTKHGARRLSLERSKPSTEGKTQPNAGGSKSPHHRASVPPTQRRRRNAAHSLAGRSPRGAAVGDGGGRVPVGHGEVRQNRGEPAALRSSGVDPGPAGGGAVDGAVAHVHRPGSGMLLLGRPTPRPRMQYPSLSSSWPIDFRSCSAL